MLDIKIVKRLERVFKGVANHNRVRILEFIAIENNTSLWQICQGLDMDVANTSQHTQRLEKAGLIEKQYVGRSVMHFLTPYGEKIYEFFKILS